MELALCIITSKADESKAKALADSMKSYVDEVVITGPDEFTWIDDFAAARNFNFSQTKADWILWLDADDTLEHPEKLRDLVRYAEQNKIAGYFVNYKYAFDSRGNCIDQHWKAQLLKNDGHFTWKGKIHEDPLQLRPARWVRTTQITRVHHSDDLRASDSHQRNLRILLKAAEEEPNEPRNYFYLGRTYIALEQPQQAIEVLEKYLTLSGWDDERYEAGLLIGKCLLDLGQMDDALAAYNAAILEKESNPDAYMQKGLVYLKKEKWNDALYNFKTALGIPVPESATFHNPLLYTRDIYSAIAICYLNLGMLKEANIAITKARQTDPEAEELKSLHEFIVAEQKKYDAARKFVEIAKLIDKPEKIQQLLSLVPPELTDNEMILALSNTFATPKVWPNKSIAVYCGSSAEPWTPASQNGKGIGGSETAVIELTKRLALAGWDITVFNYCDAPPEGLEFEGVKYRNYWTFNPKDEFDVLWVWRLPELFDYSLKARVRLLDLHDVMSPLDFTPERLSRIDKIFVKTQYHRSLFPNISDDKFVIVGNGIDLTRFENKLPREPYRFCYTSSPNRGLDVLLDMWPKIRAQIPDAELHVYYGWNTFYQIEKNNPERMAWMRKVQAKMNQDGVVDHGRVGQKELAQDLLKTSYWLYPTYFPEIDCITVKEMQAAGVTPITTGYAALEENQISGIKLPGDPYDPTWQDKYIESVISATKESFSKPDVSRFSWENVARVWEEHL